MKALFRTLIFATVATCVTGISTSHAAQYDLSGFMDALQAGTNGGFGTFDLTIPGAGDGSGTISGSYDDDTNLLSYTLTWQDLTAGITNMHFHVAPVGFAGGVDFGIPSPWTSPESGDSPLVISDANETNLLAGNWYVNIHTSNFGGGEIRGQVLVNPVASVPEPGTAGVASVGLLSLVALARRRNRLS